MKLMRQEYVTINGDVSCKISTKSLTVFQGKADETVPKLEHYISLYCAQCISSLHLSDCCRALQKAPRNDQLRSAPTAVVDGDFTYSAKLMVLG